jgi:hypothetical protein
VEASHDEAGRLDNALRASPYPVAGIDYDATVTFALHLEEDAIEPFAAWLAETTSGRCTGDIIGIEYVEVPVIEGEA